MLFLYRRERGENQRFDEDLSRPCDMSCGTFRSSASKASYPDKKKSHHLGFFADPSVLGKPDDFRSCLHYNGRVLVGNPISSNIDELKKAQYRLSF